MFDTLRVTIWSGELWITLLDDAPMTTGVDYDNAVRIITLIAEVLKTLWFSIGTRCLQGDALISTRLRFAANHAAVGCTLRVQGTAQQHTQSASHVSTEVTLVAA